MKKLSIASHQGKSQFIAEIATISAVQHRNLVKLYGCCIERDKKLLVYEYLENRSLDKALFGKRGLLLDWPTRYNICLGTARGLAYLHEESRPRIVHRDVKASNILLDADLSPKISDFGLAKLYDDNNTHISTRVAGTILDTKRMYLLEWAWNLHENNHSLELVDPTLTVFVESEAIRTIGVALLCTQASPSLRPPMSRIVAMLAGDIEVSTVTSRPGYLTDWHFNDISSSSVQDGILTSFPSRNTNSLFDRSTAPSMVVDPIPSPVNITQPMLHEIIGDEND
ncbi:hypothetical protein HHK36_004736 [Tetracentron sinense]|uniref:Protein kinase domain-containing protein n=1 Tax=Tetracentron sinense TaxID=13715 RepID=A0A835DLT9_TETSI|nr:hypothetical protein HHK36_004736 [Tetracentron sinense]